MLTGEMLRSDGVVQVTHSDKAREANLHLTLSPSGSKANMLMFL